MPRQPEKLVEPIDAPFEKVVRAVLSPKKSEIVQPKVAALNSRNNHELGRKIPHEIAAPV